MSRTLFNALLLAVLATLLGGCGLAQRLADGSRATAQAIFHAPLKTLHLDFTARAVLNSDASWMNGLSLPTQLRIYQLRKEQAPGQSSHAQWLEDDEQLLGADLLDKRSVLVNPEGGVQLSQPLDPQARFVTVVALFHSPDSREDNWRLTLSRADLDPDRPRVIELADNRLALRPLVGE